MSEDFLEAPGIVVPAETFVAQRAKVLHRAISDGRLDYVHLIECRQSGRAGDGLTEDIVVVDAVVERPQVVENDIRRVERLALAFRSDDNWYPQVFALRSDFPDVPHLNLRLADDDPRSLCLYDRSWDEVKTRWTAPGFVERIRGWLADTAIGSLHREDQPLEQVLHGSGYRLVIPWDAVKSGDDAGERLDVVLHPSGDRSGTLVAFPIAAEARPRELEFIASLFMANVRQHGIIRIAPRTLEQLCDFLAADGYDLLRDLRDRVVKWKDEGFLNASLILVIVFPLQRHSGDVEVTDTWAFVSGESVFEVGRRIGVWDKVDGRIGCIVGSSVTMRGADVELDIVRPHFSFTRDAAARASGVEADQTRILAVGVGAVGSQTILNLVKGGFGHWTFIDEDELLPHNLGRHGLPPVFVGLSKANAMAAFVNSYYADSETEATGVAANALRPQLSCEDLESIYGTSELILDLSASVPVARCLASDIRSEARRMSVFLNPLGTHLVILSEDGERTRSLDALEAQYHRAVIRNQSLKGHLAANESRTRYARSCRDLSFIIPTHLVSLHSAIASQAIRMAHREEEAIMRIWKADKETCAVTVVELPVVPSYRAEFDDWTVVLDRWLLDHLRDLRSEHLPNETGGVLVGMFDLPRKTVYVVDTIRSPEDSQEKPTLYIRGCAGLVERVEAIRNESAGEVEYIGEWHSHPDGCACAPSPDDLNLFSNLTDRMTAAGYPALMAIVCQNGHSSWFLGTMAQDAGWQAK
jgi:hypothetical protein